MYKEIPEWYETKLLGANEYQLEDLYNRYELLLDERKYTVFFFGRSTNLRAQEYNFLKAILKKKGERISAKKVMSEIGSGCKPENIQKLSYRIKSKIKNKLKDISKYRLPAPQDTNWVLIDPNWESNADRYLSHYQKFEFEKFFDMLISVKNGYYFTYFQKVNKNLQKPKRSHNK